MRYYHPPEPPFQMPEAFRHAVVKPFEIEQRSTQRSTYPCICVMRKRRILSLTKAQPESWVAEPEQKQGNWRKKQKSQKISALPSYLFFRFFWIFGLPIE